MITARDNVRKLTVAVALMFGGVLALVILLWRAAATVTSSDDDITSDYAPSVLALDSLLVDVRRLEHLVSERARQRKASPAEESEISALRSTLPHDLRAYRDLPTDPGEQPFIEALDSSFDRFEKSADRLLAVAPAAGAEDPALLSDFETTRLAVDADILRATDFNAELAERAAVRSKHIAGTLIPIAALLGIVSVLAAAAVIGFAYRSVARAESLSEASRQTLERRAEELEAFSARVAHDLLSPLATVGLAIELAKRDGSTLPRTLPALARAANTLDRVRGFVSDLLEFARAGAVPPPGSRTEVDGIVHEIAEEFLPIAQDANVDLEVKETPDRLVRCSAGVLTSLLANLVQNAIKYLGDSRERKIVIRARDLGSEVRLEVQDTGPGIPAKDQERLFEPYARGAAANVPGLGIGLATVRKLAEAHGGRAGVLSEPGHGSLFWVTLPVAQ